MSNTMSKTQAIQALKAGEKLTHYWFSPDEWVSLKNGKLEFEDGCKCSPNVFWQYRDDESWETGWKLYTGEINE